MTLNLERLDKDIQRINRGENVVGLAMRLTNDRWGAFNTEGASLTALTFPNPRGVLCWFQEQEASSAPVDTKEKI
ncbi:hypothetical protein [Leisingera caerulea]|uniref:hypothetical protein n=1 Tax=Leisingera caerulea TaxID=506591 RepID=UPI0012B67894|nr:hypothetical protein [Leisingera caerulea]